MDLKKVKTVSLQKRLSKFDVTQMIKPGKSDFDDPNLTKLAEKLKISQHTIFMMGAHVIKTGCSLIVIDLIKHGYINHIAMNGAGPIHDFELAYHGATSEPVEQTIRDGSFGMAEETGKLLNEAIIKGDLKGHGMGNSIAKLIYESGYPYKEHSILHAAYKHGIVVTVHSAIGTEIIHQHPACNGKAIGGASYTDFKKFIESVTKLEDGVVMNVGSAVILPEIFLKALSVARNLGYPVKKFAAANLDMQDHYRPRQNILERPTKDAGKAYFIKGKHQQTMPALHKKLI
mgnify:CR=1 FL=1